MQLTHDFPYDPTYGFSVEDLRRVQVPYDVPEDFESFWKDLYSQARSIEVRPEFDGPPQPEHEGEMAQPIRYNSLGGRRIGGWLLYSGERPPKRLVVFGHGYGGRLKEIRSMVPDCATLYFCARGLPRSSLFPDLPSRSAEHVIHGIESRESYILGGCAADLWCAATALQELTGLNDVPLHYWGGSFGGGLGSLALPWDNRFQSAFLRNPTFGNHDFRLSVPCQGSGESVRRLWRKSPAIRETLRYFDAATSARFNRLPAMFACAAFDPKVAPPGQFSVWQTHAGPKELVVTPAGHFTYPGQAEDNARIFDRAAQFFLEHES